jgi:hypothetical protein
MGYLEKTEFTYHGSFLPVKGRVEYFFFHPSIPPDGSEMLAIPSFALAGESPDGEVIPRNASNRRRFSETASGQVAARGVDDAGGGDRTVGGMARERL